MYSSQNVSSFAEDQTQTTNYFFKKCIDVILCVVLRNRMNNLAKKECATQDVERDNKIYRYYWLMNR